MDDGARRKIINSALAKVKWPRMIEVINNG